MNTTAYCVGYIDTESGTYLGCGIFSEPTPSTTFARFTFLIHQANGRDYEDAIVNLKRALKGPYYAWALKTLREPPPPPKHVIGGVFAPARPKPTSPRPASPRTTRMRRR